ncbi:valine--tRNA ligase [Blochmannia endosymbiont of Polyrhachis (Hedomyrma) turneri]|uniref:valine--tRNA ligase n=1 Tax=Blochmannia endosymbiont of Polyrhachis (Hedomyrma) turneri TaxID=1505596 RepID=UPI00061A661E|nr:valine--tRNA ligase [Blochmannia endosymbiont of Polyrhachis (Hedomyrma) turneri]AKC59630.1 valine-tRNA ligase [Blochmannia endosymbiont of Polyrhachis (Hedomyrma) turneri]
MHEKYNPKNIEQTCYTEWEQSDYFQPSNNINQKNYCIIMPPPNITGTLHLGHAFQHTIMDILIRYHRMQGKNTLWQPGTDHAGIATQILVERYITETENKTRHEYGKNNFTQKIWTWQSKYTDIMRYQMKRLGLSAHWKREKFTMDPEISFAVKEAFIQLYKENLIYRGHRLINWDTEIQTAISDLEIENKKIQSNMWYIKYPLSNKQTKNTNYLTVATTRPETIFGDVGIAVNPNDPRYTQLSGHYVHIPITYRKIPIIFDTYVNMKKGTGCMKITPAHDFHDYEIAKKHNLPMINIFTLNGNIRDKPEIFNTTSQHMFNNSEIYIPKQFHNVNRFIVRTQIIEICHKLQLLEKTENYEITTPYSNRTNTPTEPMITNQWFIRVQPLSKAAIEAVKHKKIKFIPKEYKKIYFHWMYNLQDWCISRQLWWGHQIPVWYDKNNKIYVGHNEKDIRKYHQLDDNILLYKETDVLDTWFSSSLWTFASLGWPTNLTVLKKFHPSNVIVSGFDIIFFWIARMIMLTMHFIKNKHNQPEIPFKTIYITGLILDETGKKMSKSQGNIIDPLDIIDGISITNLLKKRTTHMMQPKLSENIIKNTKKQFPNGIQAYGADSLRFTLTALASTGRSIHWDMQRLSGYYNFCNKLWHAGQFVLIHTTEKKFHELLNKKKTLSTSDQWILTTLQETIKTFSQALNNYRFDQAANILYTFIWHQFCNWYIEFTKTIIYEKNELTTAGTHYTLLKVLEILLRLAHPIIPFITETIWQKIKHIFEYKKSIMIQPFPSIEKSLININATIDIEWIKTIIINIRNIRNDMKIAKSIPLTIIFQNPENHIQKRIKNNFNILTKMANINHIHFSNKNKIHKKLITIPIEDTTMFIPITDENHYNTIQLNHIERKIKNIDKEIQYITNKINNVHFINNAPKSLITKQKNKLKDLQKTKQQILQQQNILFK